MGSKQIDKITCIACNEPIGLHTKNGLGRCLLRIQGTLIADVGKTAGQKTAMTEFVSQNEAEIGKN